MGVWTDTPKEEREKRLRKELKEIERLLIENGWVLSVQAKDDEMTEYVKNYNNGENVIGIEIALDPCSLGVYGRYGMGCVQIIKFEQDMPYIRDDIRRMQTLINNAERELLKTGVPFRPTYLFGDCSEVLLGDNLDLREKYHLAEYEKEDWSDD